MEVPVECRDCLKRMLPYNPRSPTRKRDGSYARPSCYYCLNWDREEVEVQPKPAPQPTDDAFKQLKAEVVRWRQKHSEALKEIDILKAKVDRGSKKYKY